MVGAWLEKGDGFGLYACPRNDAALRNAVVVGGLGVAVLP